MTHTAAAKRTRYPQRSVHRPDKRVRLQVQETGEVLEGPLLRCLNAVTPAIDAGHTLTITPLKTTKGTTR